MHDQPDLSILECGSARLQLRGDLIFTPQTTGDRTYYLVEDPLNSRFFRLGQVEYTFVTLLDGRTTIHDALSYLSTALPEHDFTETEAAAHCRWLVSMDLAHTAESAQAARLADNAKKAAQSKTQSRWNPLSIRVPLGCPDRLLGWLTNGIGWAYSPAASLAGLLLMLFGAYRIGIHWEQFSASSKGVFAPDNWIWIAACWIGLKIVHEVSHGVVCKRYGGVVRETGVLFILFAPLAYVDVTSSWRFRSRWQRMHVAAAGMYCELLIAAAAAVVWSQTESGWLNNLCFNVILMASLTTLLFNANPLMKFDGYYILSDGLSLPNLYVNGQAYLRAWARRHLLGVSASLPDWGRREALMIACYGWASFVWRIVVCVGMVVTAATLFRGAGVLLAILAGVLWLGLPAYYFLKFFVAGEAGERPQRIRFLAIVGSAATLATLVLGFVPWPGARQAPGVVEYSPHLVVRASCAGFIDKVHVRSGQRVESGQLLVEMENRQLKNDLADLALQIRLSEIRGRTFEQKGELASQQAEEKSREALQTQLAEKQVQVEQLAVRAVAGGLVIGRNLDALEGIYLKEGDEILAIGDESKKKLHLSIAQDDLDVFTQRVGKEVQIDLPGLSLWNSRLEKVIPRATLTPPHPAFAAANGGPLPVQQASHRSEAGNDEGYELLAPRFTALVDLDPTHAASLLTGQRAVVRYRSLNETVGQHLHNAFSAWLRARLSESL